MTEHRRVERAEPLPIKGQTLGVFVPVATIEYLAQLTAAGFHRETLQALIALRSGPRRLERIT